MSEIVIPTVVTATGLVPIPPADLRATLVGYVATIEPDYTADLPGSLIENIASTDVGALTLIDNARVETFQSISPYTANPWLLTELGNVYGVEQGAATRTSVNVIFTGTPGFVVAQGFVISDGTHQYTVQDGGVIATGGDSALLFCLATTDGVWAVAADTVTTVITSVPDPFTLTVTNPSTGTPGAAAQSEESYRVDVLQAGLAASTGMSRYLKTLLGQVDGVQQRLVAAVQIDGGGWEVIVGGGDPFEVAYAIYYALFDISLLVGSSINVTGITNASPGVVTTNLNHGYADMDVVTIEGVVGMSGINGVPLTVTVLTEKTFSIGINTTSSGSWTSGGVCTPNDRNQAVTIIDYPDNYLIRFVLPPQQTVTIVVTWNTSSTFVVSAAGVAQLGAQPLVDYVNSIYVGQPMNLFQLQEVFTAAIATILPPSQLTRMVFAVDIDGVSVPPSAGTGVIAGDPESYFFCELSGITITQG